MRIGKHVMVSAMLQEPSETIAVEMIHVETATFKAIAILKLSIRACTVGPETTSKHGLRVASLHSLRHMPLNVICALEVTS